jgi:mRNA interferase MazF
MATARKVVTPRRRDIFVVSFDPTLGAEIQKTRPALVLQNDIANRFSPITIVAAITSQLDAKLYPTEVLIKAPEGGLERDSVVLLNQVRSIDRQRLVRRLGRVTAETMRDVERALAISMGLVEI